MVTLRGPRMVSLYPFHYSWWFTQSIDFAESLSDWNKFLKTKYVEMLRSRLSEEEMTLPAGQNFSAAEYYVIYIILPSFLQILFPNKKNLFCNEYNYEESSLISWEKNLI